MNLFNEIDGKKGEQLTSAVLRFLLLRSEPLRESVIQLISDQSRVGPVILDSHFGCQLEVSTKDTVTDQSGRLDILIETDDMLIGIENKLTAAFQEDQPKKYLDTLDKTKSKLSELRGKSYGCFVAILAPNDRESEIKAIIQKNEQNNEQDYGKCIFIAWENVLNGIGETYEALDSITLAVSKSFVEYTRGLVSLFHDFDKWGCHLWHQRPSGDSVIHCKFLHDMVAKILEKQSSRTSGNGYTGYYFYWNADRETKGWIYFVSKDRLLQDAKHEAELLIATDLEVGALSKEFYDTKAPDGWGDPKRCWRIDIDPDSKHWRELKSWQDLFKPFIDAVNSEKERIESGETQPPKIGGLG